MPNSRGGRGGNSSSMEHVPHIYGTCALWRPHPTANLSPSPPLNLSLPSLTQLPISSPRLTSKCLIYPSLCFLSSSSAFTPAPPPSRSSLHPCSPPLKLQPSPSKPSTLAAHLVSARHTRSLLLPATPASHTRAHPISIAQKKKKHACTPNEQCGRQYVGIFRGFRR